MRIGVIRGDLPGPVFLGGLEVVSQYNPSTEPRGQQRYLSRPTSTSFALVMGQYAPASLGSAADITFPLTINGGNQTLKIKSAAADAFTSVLIATGVYANITTLLAAINAALPAAFIAVPLATAPTLRVAFQTVAKGEAVRIQYDTTVGGSTANTPLALTAGGATFTTATAATVIAATVPVGGPIDVRPATLRTQLGAGLTAVQVTALQDGLAPRLVETDVAIKSFQVGDLARLLSSSFNPDVNRIPGISSGAAIAVVADDGQTIFTAPVPTISNAQFNTPTTGAITITGTGLAGAGSPNSEVVSTRVKILSLPDARHISQAAIIAAGGTVSSTSIVIPASVIPTGAGIGVGTKVQVKYTSLISNAFTLV